MTEYLQIKASLSGKANKPRVNDLTDDDICRHICTELVSDGGEYEGQNFPTLYFATQSYEEGKRLKYCCELLIKANFLNKELINPQAFDPRYYVYKWSIANDCPIK
ncbi:hypothetical protein P4M96_004736 [Escherichia coli]|nr:hypothetical protein [Escherichia coli]